MRLLTRRHRLLFARHTADGRVRKTSSSSCFPVELCVTSPICQTSPTQSPTLRMRRIYKMHMRMHIDCIYMYMYCMCVWIVAGYISDDAEYIIIVHLTWTPSTSLAVHHNGYYCVPGPIRYTHTVHVHVHEDVHEYIMYTQGT